MWAGPSAARPTRAASGYNNGSWSGLLSILVFTRVWGFPRADLGLLVSAVMVLFAASHHRAD